MAKRSFLIPVAVALAALTSSTQASTQTPQAVILTDSKNVAEALPRANPHEQEMLLQGGNDLFRFVLRTSASGDMVADHYSHSSHASHESHASHSSHYSSRQ